MQKTNVCVFFGGQSSEFEVSCVSASSIIANLDEEKFEITMVGITKEGNWYLYTGPVSSIADGTWAQGEVKRCVLSPDPRHRGLIVMNKNGDYTIKHVDVLFPVLHGKNGEDGTIQGLFELSGLPYVGDGVLASAAAMDKACAKLLFASAGLPQAKYLAYSDITAKASDQVAADIEREFGYPCFVKPANAGSSVGITKVADALSLKEALKTALEHDRRIVIEQAITGREIECSVLGGHTDISASCCGEIKPAAEFYDYEAKYVRDDSELMIPAAIDAQTEARIQEYAIQAFRAVDGFGLARCDFFLTDAGEVLLNEINTLPGFTSISMYPKLWEENGLFYKDLLTRLVELAKSR